MPEKGKKIDVVSAINPLPHRNQSINSEGSVSRRELVSTVGSVLGLAACAGLVGSSLTSAEEVENPASLETLPLPSASSLSLTDQQKAISFFRAQRAAWLAVQSGSANYILIRKVIKNGKIVDAGIPRQFGTLKFLVQPLLNRTSRQGPVQVITCLTNDTYKWSFLNENVFDPAANKSQWADNPAFTLEDNRVKFAKAAFQTELFFLPVDFVARSYQDSLIDDENLTTSEIFFADRGLPRRLSTEQESQEQFNDELQYLFMATPAIVDSVQWFSAVNGQLRQIDMFVEPGVVKSFRYDNYLQLENRQAQFPRQFTLTLKKGSGQDQTGWQYCIYLKSLKLNVPVSF